MTAPTMDFAEFFRRGTDHEPYAYQRALADASKPPAVLEVPTGAGKTEALILSWLYQRQVRGVGPRRLVYTLPMRSLVEQTRDVAERVTKQLGLGSDAISIHTLMGGTDAAELREWQLRPEQDQILIGTIDMLLSRALNRGYGASRFVWPVAFGLLNNDCRWVFDEIQLMGSARATSAQLDGLRRALGTELPCETIWVSATVDRDALETVDRPRLGDIMSLPEEDREGALQTRLHARKTLERIDAAGQSGENLAKLIAAIAEEQHQRATRTLVVVNTVELAQLVYKHLKRSPARTPTVLLHSRFRPQDRALHMHAVIDPPGDQGTIVIATQVVEAGIDLSSRTLITETAPFSSIIQRLGRCNRAGEYGEATVLWLDRGPIEDGTAGRKATAPYAPSDIESARTALLSLQSSSLSPAALEDLNVAESADEPTVLRRRDLLDLFDSSPDLSGTDIDIAPFIRDDDDRSVAVLFRDLAGDAPFRIAGKDTPERACQDAPERAELVQVPLASLGRRSCWVIERASGDWVKRTSRDVPPGATVMLRSAEGGYDPEIGWDGKSKQAVRPVTLEEQQPVQGTGSDPDIVVALPQELLVHLEAVADEATGIAQALGLRRWQDVLRCAGALHDIGKAHHIFQDALRSVILTDEADDEQRHVWAKSGSRPGEDKPARYERRYFRHELASALVVRQLDSEIEVPERNLTSYLIGSHHGKVRLSIRPGPDEERPAKAAEGARFALGIIDGDLLPEVQTPIGAIPATELDLSQMELGAEDSWTEAALTLRDDPALGPFRLGFLEAILRIADWRASGA